MKTRIFFLDNLRTFLVFFVILYHAGFVYQSSLAGNWLVVDPVKSESIALVGMYIDTFVMFMLFFISGYFVPGSLKNKTARGFLSAKFKRIYLPWFIAVFTLIPAYKTIFLYARGLPQEEWFSYFHFFQRTGTDLNFFANSPSQHWLWFLPILFLFQVLYLILSKTNFLTINISLKTAVALIFVIGVIYSMIISNLGLKGWSLNSVLDFQRERLLVYFMVFLLGSLCYKLKIFESDKRSMKYLILSNVVLTLALTVYTIVALNLFFNIIDPERNFFFISSQIDRIAYYSSLLLTMLSFIYIFVDLFRFKLNKTNKLMNHLNTNSYYVYIIHMIVLGLIALVLVNIPIPSVIKYLILTLLTFVVSHFIIYVYNRIIQKVIQ
ncbi:MAG: fucose 4-O-acetylase-like acetyltransferase [Saprospiraceae bacterium]|jgi:fucose 4-O-acetylase-like acetyltransferase